MSKYLLEIGTEELPYKFIPQAVEQLKSGFELFFKEQNISFEKINVLATPRRLALIVQGLSDKQPDEEKIIKGPIKNAAYDENGNFTKAALGFAAKFGVDEKDLFIQDNYLHAKVFTKGKSTLEALEQNVPSIVLKLQGPYFMRWGKNEEKFSRPIRWIVSIMDDKEVPVEIANVKSSKKSRGHRFSPNFDIEITNADNYAETLKKSHVIVDQKERKDLIIKLAKQEAAKHDAELYYDEDLLDEVTYLCEYPVPCVCEFDKKYLDIPEMVTVTVMTNHQRYFALYKNGKLLNKFITITNYLGDDFSNIKAGNERVIVARLDDAIFFFKEDTKKPFANFVENLKGVTFQKGMGSIYDKTQRVISLSKEIASKLNASSSDIERTALLCKADLTTSLVFEFTELQGFIGSDYAKISGENEKVVQGIKEHYFPLNAESELAQGIEGQIVGIADKLDTICAVFVNGKKPTGSSDPLGVRRAALGIIKTITNKKLDINLAEIITKTLELLPVKADVQSQIEEFFVQRLIIFLAETYRKDVLEACSNNKNPLFDLCDFTERVILVTSAISDPKFASILESANRIGRIIGSNSVVADVSENMLQHEAEKELYSKIKTIKDSSYKELFEGLKSANSAIENFFEHVLVMDKDEKIKQNRLSMLGMLKNKYNLLADFSFLQI